ncbi:hypothetical protein M413DRAFT_62944 [Hebeloma cylindrosporum]|uniref:Homeobox domain-containing protein n=1 Tax=Hebeloma cylindrosporum TaxID=76867 RepID=A0A0C3CVH4_HEBCY|nr:hypothetical protein M413DRAFT_62944 [Hebeloma cylindrosporum h7]
MTTTSPQTQLGPLHFLANVVSDIDSTISHRSQTPSSTAGTSVGSSSPSSSSEAYSPPASFLPDVASLHIPCNAGSSREKGHRALRHSNTSNQSLSSDPHFVPFRRVSRRTRKTSESHLRNRMQMKTKRNELLEKATKIKSLDNSPVNERQLFVLRMVYDEITMYPCESWMVILAIVIQRAYKQVKNWFSNERQKNRTGESIPFETEDGDKVRLRSSVLSTCQDWSDSVFEEIVMIYNYRIQRNSRFGRSLRRPDDIPDHDH